MSGSSRTLLINYTWSRSLLDLLRSTNAHVRVTAAHLFWKCLTFSWLPVSSIRNWSSPDWITWTTPCRFWWNQHYWPVPMLRAVPESGNQRPRTREPQQCPGVGMQVWFWFLVLLPREPEPHSRVGVLPASRDEGEVSSGVGGEITRTVQRAGTCKTETRDRMKLETPDLDLDQIWIWTWNWTSTGL